MRALLVGLVLLGACKPEAREVERRVLVDPVADCVALRKKVSQCAERFVDVLLERRAGLSAEERPAARERLLGELRAEAGRPEEERVATCKQASAEMPAPSPADVTTLHRCLPQPCEQAAQCLRPVLLRPGS